MSRLKFLVLPAVATVFAGTVGLAGQGVAQTAPAAAPPAFLQCKACHATTANAPRGLGPSLFGVMGTQAGKRPGFAFSPALANSGLKWDRANLEAFITNPRTKVPGNRMAYAGMANPAQRKAVLDYLQTLK